VRPTVLKKHGMQANTFTEIYFEKGLLDAEHLLNVVIQQSE